MRIQSVFNALVLSIVIVTTQARAADTRVAAGETLNLSADLVLVDNDVLEVSGTADKPCTIVGNGFAIKAKSGWSGQAHIAYATLKDLGKAQKVIRTENPGGYPSFKITDPDAPAIAITSSGAADVTIDHCTFDASSMMVFTVNDQSTLAVRSNTILDNATYPVSEQPVTSRPPIRVEGNSTAKKFFQGNRIPKGVCQFETPNMLIGGDKDEESNIIIGVRAKIEASGSGTVIKGNYIHCLLPGPKEPPYAAYWSQVSTFTPGRGTLAEHNIIRDGEWIVQFVEGEFRYNLICDILDHNLLRNGSTGKIHHNIFFAGKPDHFMGQMGGAIMLVYPPKGGQTGIEIYNNTFDGTDTFAPPGVEVCTDGLVASLRNNVFFNFKQQPKFVRIPSAIVSPTWTEDKLTDLPARLTYSDYNCFYNPLSAVKTIYALSVKDKTLRKDDGYGKHDLPADGDVNAQVDPKFKGPLPKVFPFKDEDIKSGKVTVSQILKFYRDAYTPAAESPLINAGDPADGKNSYIGAVGPGNDAPLDRFGKVQAPSADKAN